MEKQGEGMTEVNQFNVQCSVFSVKLQGKKQHGRKNLFLAGERFLLI